MAEAIAPGVTEPFWRFLGDACGVTPSMFRRIAADELPELARPLLVHQRDMTSTLATFHGSALHVEILQQRQSDGLYLREVFLRTVAASRMVEYGVIAIALEQFAPAQQVEIRAGRTPLGGLLHQFQIPFESSPICFVAVATSALPGPLRAVLHGPICYGRFNRLARPAGATLAWILEILPPDSD